MTRSSRAKRKLFETAKDVDIGNGCKAAKKASKQESSPEENEITFTERVNVNSGKKQTRTRTRSRPVAEIDQLIEVPDNGEMMHDHNAPEHNGYNSKGRVTTVQINDSDEGMTLQVEADEFLSEEEGENAANEPNLPEGRNNNARLKEVEGDEEVVILHNPDKIDEEERKSMMRFAMFLEQNGYLHKDAAPSNQGIQSTGESHKHQNDNRRSEGTRAGTSGEPSQT